MGIQPKKWSLISKPSNKNDDSTHHSKHLDGVFSDLHYLHHQK